jgi:hypothetical protein
VSVAWIIPLIVVSLAFDDSLNWKLYSLYGFVGFVVPVILCTLYSLTRSIAHQEPVKYRGVILGSLSLIAVVSTQFGFGYLPLTLQEDSVDLHKDPSLMQSLALYLSQHSGDRWVLFHEVHKSSAKKALFKLGRESQNQSDFADKAFRLSKTWDFKLDNICNGFFYFLDDQRSSSPRQIDDLECLSDYLTAMLDPKFRTGLKVSFANDFLPRLKQLEAMDSYRAHRLAAFVLPKILSTLENRDLATPELLAHLTRLATHP